MSDNIDYELYDKFLTALMIESHPEPDDLDIGENISAIPEIKIIFDGYGDLEEEDENGEYQYTEGGNTNMESYAIFIHKDSAQEGFEFPEHDFAWNLIIHRTKEEVCIYAWYDVENDEWSINSLYETSEHTMTDEEVMAIIKTLNERYYATE